MNIVPFSHVMILAGLLFAVGMVCMIARRNLIMMLLGLEILLNACSIAFVGASLRWQQMDGQSMAFFIMAVAAAEVSVGLALIVAVFRAGGRVDPSALRIPETSGDEAARTG